MGTENTSKTAARKAAASAPQTPEAASEKREVAASVTRDRDRVAAVSRRADGTPDQTADFEVLGSKKD